MRPDDSLLIDSVCRLVTSIPRHLDRIVLNHVLLDDGLTRAQSRRLTDSRRIEVGLGDEAIVAWDMRRGLGRTHS